MKQKGKRRNVKCECYCRTLKPVGIAGLKLSICTAKEIIELMPACVVEESLNLVLCEFNCFIIFLKNRRKPD